MLQGYINAKKDLERFQNEMRSGLSARRFCELLSESGSDVLTGRTGIGEALQEAFADDSVQGQLTKLADLLLRRAVRYEAQLVRRFLERVESDCLDPSNSDAITQDE